MSQRIQQWIPLAVLIVAAVIACLLSAATPDRVDTPRPIECPYQVIDPCPYQQDR